MNPEELANNYINSRRVIADLFGKEWLGSGENNELQKLWKRTDWIAHTELLIFGHCLEKCWLINKDRAKYFVETIKKSSNRNERRGCIYEIIVAGAYYDEGSTLVEFPPNPNNPGYDLKLIQDKITIYISIKTYGLFQRVDEFVEKSKEIEGLIKQNINNGCNSVFIIDDRSHPNLLDWNSLQEVLPKLLISNSKKIDDNWSIFVKYTTGNSPTIIKNIFREGSISPEMASYILFLITRLHKNDLKNLFDKIDDACINFEDHGEDNSDAVNIIFVRVPREIDLESCKLKIDDYFEHKQSSKVSGIFLYQPEFVFVNSSGESLTHCYEFIINPNNKEIKHINIIPKFLYGLTNKGSVPIMFVTGINDIMSKDVEYYKYQSGHIFYQPSNEKEKPMIINGILIEPLISSTPIDENSIIRRQLLPENDALLLL